MEDRVMTATLDPNKPTPHPENRYLNRELSWLSFNERVLEEALDPLVPLLERLRYLTIYHTNLDEFFMIRISGLKQQIQAGLDVLSADGKSPRSQLHALSERIKPMHARASQLLHQELLPSLESHGVSLVNYDQLTLEEHGTLDRWYLGKVHPILTPLAVGPTHPFPFISNLSMNLAIWVTAPSGERRLARVKVPDVLPRLLSATGSDIELPVRVLPLEQLIAANLDTLFPGMQVGRPYAFRVTRDADVEIKDDEADDLMTVLQEGLRQRRFGQAVRLEVQSGIPEDLCEGLREGLDLDVIDVDDAGEFLAIPDLGQLISFDLPELKFPPYVPRLSPPFPVEDAFSAARKGGVLMHLPFESFKPTVDFIQQAARDPHVLAIKQTLYRTNGDSPIVQALLEAIESGKQVAAVVELKARFDEQNNIEWAEALESAGCHVIYGMPGLKTHCKLALVVRDEGGELRRYAHISTGNYNSVTARIYTDLGLITTDPAITADVADVFNKLTGFAQPSGYRKLLVAPHHMKKQLVDFIRHEAGIARDGKPARIIVKCNAITDRDIIDELYAASNAGVRIDLLIRGICCLFPRVPGLSENISVRSVLGRYLEHSRVFWFNNGDDPIAYMGSADWMDRNLVRRVEVLVPILEPKMRDWIRNTYLQRYLDDTERTHVMQSDGSYVRIRSAQDHKSRFDVHDQFMLDGR
jgi:polyphosphate kinase